MRKNIEGPRPTETWRVLEGLTDCYAKLVKRIPEKPEVKSCTEGKWSKLINYTKFDQRFNKLKKMSKESRDSKYKEIRSLIQIINQASTLLSDHLRSLGLLPHLVPIITQDEKGIENLVFINLQKSMN